MEENLNPINDGQQAVVEPLNIESANDIETTNVETQEVVEPVKPIQTAEDNARFAAARRDAEAKAKEYEELIKKEKERTEKFAKNLGYSSFEDIENQLARELEEKEKVEYKQKYGVDKEALKPLIEAEIKNDPLYREVVEIKKQREEELKTQHLLTQINLFNKEFDGKLEKIEDIASLPNIEKMMPYFSKGLNLIEAYKLVNFDEIATKKLQNKAQNISNSGRGHLDTTIGNADDLNSITVPRDILERYKKRGFTDEKIRKIYKQAYGL